MYSPYVSLLEVSPQSGRSLVTETECTISNAYDRSESPIATTLPHGETHEFGWTPVGLPSSYTAPEAPDAGRRLERTYNAAREQSTLVKPDGTVVSNIYDSAGRLSAVVATRGDETERVDFVYDYAGRLDSVTNEYRQGGDSPRRRRRLGAARLARTSRSTCRTASR